MPNLEKKPMILLAPMEGVVDPIMRELLTAIGGFDYCATEFVRVTHRLNPDHVFRRYCPELDHSAELKGKTKAGTPVYLQILGGDPNVMAENAAAAAALGALGIDINFGCPAKTVNRHDGGSVILQSPDRVFKIANAIRKATPEEVPVTVKVRLGFMDSTLALENAIAAEEAGAAWLTVHARTKADAYKPPAKWAEITELKEKLKIPVIANGDIWNIEDANRCRKVTGCEDLMLGRGAIAYPFLAQRILSGIIFDQQADWQEFTPIFIRFIEMSESVGKATGKNGYGAARCKQWLRLLGRNFPQALSLFDQVKRMKDFAEMHKVFSAEKALCQNFQN